MSDTRILKWIIPVDDQEYRLQGEFLHIEPMSELEREQGEHIRGRGEGPDEWVTIWTRVGEGQEAFLDNAGWRSICSYRVFGTGQPIEDSNDWVYCGTARQPAGSYGTHLVWHLMCRVSGIERIST